MRLAGTIGGVEVPQTMWMSWRVRDGLLVWWATFRTEARSPRSGGAAGVAMSHENVEVVRSI